MKWSSERSSAEPRDLLFTSLHEIVIPSVAEGSAVRGWNMMPPL